MATDTALYVCNDSTRQESLDCHLQSLGIEVHNASSTSFAKQKIYERKYSLLLIQFESVINDVFDLCTFTRIENNNAVIIILMSKVQPAIESRLFDYGVDDIAAGKQLSLNAQYLA
jgi:DNA-binding response OmpR family regulator